MSDDWPDDDALLQLVKESAEHKRAWALIAGLSKRVLQEREAWSMLRKAGGIPPHYDASSHRAKPIGNRPRGYADHIHELEDKIVKQKEQLRELNACREFEAETERLLVAALEKIIKTSDWHTMGLYARDALAENLKRKGPRPAEVEWGPDSPGYDEMGQ